MNVFVTAEAQPNKSGLREVKLFICLNSGY